MTLQAPAKRSSFEDTIALFRDAHRRVADHPEAHRDHALPGNVYVLPDAMLLCLPRRRGDSRYHYGHNGYSFWAHATGAMNLHKGIYSYFLTPIEGQEPSIAFFVALPLGDGRFEPVSLLQAPCIPSADTLEAERFTIFTPNSVYYFTHVRQFQFIVRAFVTQGAELCISVHATNAGDSIEAPLVASYFNPFMRRQVYASQEDRWFKEIRIEESDDNSVSLPEFAVRVFEELGRDQAITHDARLRRRLTPETGCQVREIIHTTSRDQFVGGPCGSVHAPLCLLRGELGEPKIVTTFADTAVAADLIALEMGPESSFRLDIMFTPEGAEAAPSQLDPEELDVRLDRKEARGRSNALGLSLTVDEPCAYDLSASVVNAFFHHLKRQVEFCALIEGGVQVHENSLIGIRDLFQALEALLYWRPKAVRAKILEALEYMTPEGRCFRQYSLPDDSGEPGRMDLRPFVDQGCWVISCLMTYLRVTGDLSILTQTVGYHEILDEDLHRVRRADVRDSVLEHLLGILNYLLAQRDLEQTGCIRALYGDWNDALDGLGESGDPDVIYGTGVSVMATLQVYRNADEVADLLEHIDAETHRCNIDDFRQAKTDLETSLLKFAVQRDGTDQARIIHGWGDRRSYLVCSSRDPDGQARDSLTSYAFWTLSGMTRKYSDWRGPILEAFDRLDSPYGMKTFEPAFRTDCAGVGRIRKLPPGTAENGATYVHATAFAIMALFEMGEPDKAWDQLFKILPFTNVHEKLSHSPFVMPNSYGFNPELGINGESMNDWQTGSSNVVLKLFINYVFGFSPGWNGFWIQPAKNSPFARLSAELYWRDRRIRITCENRHSGARRFAVAGSVRQGVRDEVIGIEKLWIGVDEIPVDGLVEIEISD